MKYQHEALWQCPWVLQHSEAVVRIVCLTLAFSWNASVGWAQLDRVEGVVESVQAPEAVRV